MVKKWNAISSCDGRTCKHASSLCSHVGWVISSFNSLVGSYNFFLATHTHSQTTKERPLTGILNEDISEIVELKIFPRIHDIPRIPKNRQNRWKSKNRCEKAKSLKRGISRDFVFLFHKYKLFPDNIYYTKSSIYSLFVVWWLLLCSQYFSFFLPKK